MKDETKAVGYWLLAAWMWVAPPAFYLKLLVQHPDLSSQVHICGLIILPLWICGGILATKVYKRHRDL